MLALVSVAAVAVVLTRDPGRQAYVAAGYGFLLALLFFGSRAPGAAIAELIAGVVVVPGLALMALAKMAAQGPAEIRAPDPVRRPAGKMFHRVLFLVGAAVCVSILMRGISAIPQIRPAPELQGNPANAVAAVAFDYRAFDTMIVVFILLGCGIAVALLFHKHPAADLPQATVGIGAGGYIAVGAVGLLTATAFLSNFSGAFPALLGLAVTLAVAGGLALLFLAFRSEPR